MPERSSYVAGTPCWVDVSTADFDATIAFYAGLFGWEPLRPTEPDAGGYTLFTKDGKNVAAAGPNMEGAPFVWTTYIASDDVDATAAKVTAAGGTLLMEPFDVMDAGRMALALDPTGAMFGIWQAGKHIGAELVNEPGALVWNELHTGDLAAANAFYGAVFGWTQQPFGDDPTFRYDVQKVTDQSIGGIFQSDGATGWQAYFSVADPDATAAKAVELGGEIVREPADYPYGRDTLLRDPQGATFHALRIPDSQ
jgi:predicted enzyme related to lactoylglutathione lyase